uniref:GATOR complex protein NPRL3 n=1 Tax=Macrostomum lignano TaxID=282301 RepID=A0A1I8FF47_9PLAT
MPCAPKSINKLYIQLARQLTTALRHEEQRCKFLHAQQELINQLMAELEDARQQRRQILDRLNERSQLCRSLTSVFCQLRRGGRVSLRLNGWLPISFCLAHKMHRLQTFACETDMAYSVALEFARHLVRWGCAIICHPAKLTPTCPGRFLPSRASWRTCGIVSRPPTCHSGLLTWLLRRRLAASAAHIRHISADPVDVADATFAAFDDACRRIRLPQLPARLRDRLSPPVQLTIQRLPQSSERPIWSF